MKEKPPMPKIWLCAEWYFTDHHAPIIIIHLLLNYAEIIFRFFSKFSWEITFYNSTSLSTWYASVTKWLCSERQKAINQSIVTRWWSTIETIECLCFDWLEWIGILIFLTTRLGHEKSLYDTFLKPIAHVQFSVI